MVMEEAKLTKVKKFSVTSNVFTNKGFIPEKYTCDGDNISPPLIKEGAVPGKEGVNTLWVKEYSGPYPLEGTHRYFFKVYALDTILNLPMKIIGKYQLEKAMESHIIGYGELIGLYKRA